MTQGVLGQFRRATGTPLYTGDLEFEVCATGIDMQFSQTGPTQVEINEQITLCNSGSGDPPDAASIDPESHWMWYQPGGVPNPFHSTGTNTFRAYLIFRLAASDLPPPR